MRKRRQRGLPALAVSLGLSAVIVLAGLMGAEGLHAARLTRQLLWPLVRLLIMIACGLAVGQLIEVLGWTRQLSILARPLFRFGRLGERCGAAFTAAFFSGVTANAMLLDFFKEGKISRQQLFLTNFVNHVPAYVLHLPTTFFIVIPLTGWAGGLYFMLTFAALVLRTLLFVGYGHWKLAPLDPPGQAAVTAGPAPAPRKTWGQALQSVRQRIPDRLMGVVLFVVPIYCLVFVVNALGFFQWARHALTGLVVSRLLPVESFSAVVLSFAAEFTSGFAAAGALMQAGVLTIKQTVLALLIGNIVAFPVRALRHQLPRYMGIFAPKMGLQLLLMGQGFRVASLMVVGVVYYWVA